MKIKCITVDDEPLALHVLADYIGKIPFLELQAQYTNPLEAIECVKTENIGLVFLDIEMEELSGFDFINILQHKPQFILTTAYDSYAIRGFEFQVSDYLLKPISFERFARAVEKVHNTMVMMQHLDAARQPAPDSKYFFVKTENRLERINFDDILYIEGLADYLKIVTVSRKVLTLMSFNEILSHLPARQFVRVHKSFVVSLSRITMIENQRVVVNDTWIPISKTYKANFFKNVGCG